MLNFLKFAKNELSFIYFKDEAEVDPTFIENAETKEINGEKFIKIPESMRRVNQIDKDFLSYNEIFEKFYDSKKYKLNGDKIIEKAYILIVFKEGSSCRNEFGNICLYGNDRSFVINYFLNELNINKIEGDFVSVGSEQLQTIIRRRR